MSNAAWSTKRQALQDHSLLLLNREVCRHEQWSEDEIAARGRVLAHRIVERWPGPQRFMPDGWRAREAESWPEGAEMPLEHVEAAYSGGTPYLRALMVELARSPGHRRTFAQVEEALGWPRGRLRSVAGGYALGARQRFDGRRPWHIHLDEDGKWWIWMDEERARVVSDEAITAD